MQTVLGIIACLIVLILLLLVTPVRINLFFSHIGGKTSGKVCVGLGFLQINLTKLLQKKQRTVQKKENPETEPEKEKKKFTFSDFESALTKGVEAFRYLRKKFTVRHFSLHVRMALGDAADTGVATGAGYASIYGILGAIDRYFVLKKHEVVITPVFQGMGLEIEFRTAFQLRMIYCLGLINKIRKGDAV